MGCGSSKHVATDVGLTAEVNVAGREEAGEEELKVSASNFVISSSKRIKDNYKIGEIIGKGAFGEIVEVHHIPTKSDRAIKILYKEQPKEETSEDIMATLEAEEQNTMNMDELKNEIAMMRSLDHSNILKMFEFFEDEKRFYLAMELCKGGTVMDMVPLASTSETDCALIMKQVLGCVNFMHRKGVIHRDLKPENILLQKKKQYFNLKVIDFGIAVNVKEGERLSQGCGTPNFIAPEIYKQDYSFPVDIWACGVISYMILVGKAPFFVMGADSPEEMLEILEKGVDMYDTSNNSYNNLELSDDAKDFVTKLLNFDEKLRLTAAQALQHPFLQKAPREEDLSSADTTDALTNLADGANRNLLAQATHAYIASQLVTQSEHDRMTKIFQALDPEHVGTLDLPTFKKGYLDFMGELKYNEEETEKLFNNLDGDKSGTVDYSEFVAGMVSKSGASVKSKMKSVFDAFDLDGGGSISKDEIMQILSFGSNKRVNDKLLATVMETVDKDGDGNISLDEFMVLLEII